MKWSDQYSIGVARLDMQHRWLFKMSEDYRTALDERQGERVYSVMLESFDQFARGHFGLEERCMDQYRCPVAEANRAAHGQFIDTLAEFRRRYADRGFNLADAQQLVQYIDDWLANHILRIDVQLKPCIEKADRP